eukprot:9727651-Alexandrium_andersonii.AAC.1
MCIRDRPTPHQCLAAPPGVAAPTPFLPGAGGPWATAAMPMFRPPGHPPLPAAAVARPSGFQPIAPQLVPQHRINVVQALVGDPALLGHIR